MGKGKNGKKNEGWMRNFGQEIGTELCRQTLSISSKAVYVGWGDCCHPHVEAQSWLLTSGLCSMAAGIKRGHGK
jgi:hypothetical protein